MVWSIALREITDNVQSLKFLLGSLLTSILFGVSGWTFTDRYIRAIEDYYMHTNHNLSEIRRWAGDLSKVAVGRQTIYRKPKVLEVIVGGSEELLPNSLKVNAFSVGYPENLSRGNFLLPSTVLDWNFVIILILSMLALVLTYDSFSGERERGTLSLLMANPIPRYKVVISKYIGGILSLAIPFSFGVLINLLIVSRSVPFDTNQWLKVIAIYAVSIAYLSTFVLMGLLVSVRARRSSTSIVVLLLIWVVLVAIVPGCGRIVADRVYKVPGRAEVEERIEEVRRDIWDRRTRPPSRAGYSIQDPFKDEWARARAEMFNEMTEARNRILERYTAQLMKQILLTRVFLRVSPTCAYQFASEAIAGTGIVGFENFYEQVIRYRRTLMDWVLDEDRRDPNSPHLVYAIQFQGRTLAPFISKKPVDFKAIPKFQEVEPTPTASLRQALWDICLLIVLNVGLFIGTYASFSRRDIV